MSPSRSSLKRSNRAIGDHAVEDAVTEKLQPLVVGRTEATMGDACWSSSGRGKRWPMAFCRASRLHAAMP